MLYQRIQAGSAGARNVDQIEQTIKEFPHSPFPQYQSTKRPDMAVTSILEGRLAIIKEGAPIIILAPANFFTFFHAPDDLHTNPLLASGMRLARIAAILAVILLPGLYVAVSSFHYQFLKLEFLLMLAESRVRVPFLPVMEVLLMEAILAIFYELVTRLSSHTGAWVAITSGLFLTGALLTTGLVSSFLLIISAVSFMASFLIPIYHIQTIRLLRLMFILFAAVFGMLGVAISASLTFSHLIVLKSLGRPYLQPFTPRKKKESNRT
jgi:spore germination protein